MKFVLNRRQFTAGFDDRVFRTLQFHGLIGRFSRRQHAGIYRVDMAFEQHFWAFALIRHRVRPRAVGAGNPHADVVDRETVHGLQSRAFQVTVQPRHDVFRRKAPFFGETLCDFRLSAHFEARGRRDPRQFHLGVETPFLSRVTHGFGENFLNDGILDDGVGRPDGFRRDFGLSSRYNEREDRCNKRRRECHSHRTSLGVCHRTSSGIDGVLEASEALYQTQLQ